MVVPVKAFADAKHRLAEAIGPDARAALARDLATRVVRAARGLPVYGLRQPNGSVRLYFGAYGTAEQASLAVPQVRDAGMRPLLVYRIGRVF